jgi:hypothetical protein
MAENQNNEHEMIYNESSSITYHQFGFRSAQHANSRPDSMEGFLNKVYDRFLDEQKLDEKGITDMIAKLKAEVLQEKSKKNEANATLSSLKIEKTEKEKEIEELELQKIDIKNADGESIDTIPFVIGSFITLLLTLYLFVFYSSSGYSAFYGIKKGSLGFINPNIFAEAMNKGGGVIALIILFPVIFLGLGFLIHTTLENNKKLKTENKPAEYGLIISLLLITLIADIFIGYKISQAVQINSYNAGLTEDLWRFDLIFSDINFYLVLLLGFVVYVIWGFLLHYVLSHPYLKSESEKVKLLLENISKKILEKKSELTDIISKIFKIDNEIITSDARIIEKEDKIIGLQNGVIPINVASLKSSVGEFLGGWQAYTNNNFDSTSSKELVGAALVIQENWINSKIENLNIEK